MTLLEMLVALVVFGVVVGGAFSFLRYQSRGYRFGAEQMDALQNLRFAANALELDLRTAGSNVPDEQPYIIYAGSDVVAFNADYATNVENDVWAVYYDRDSPTGSVMALTKARRITIPTTSFGYPDTSYRALGGLTNSPAETIVFYFESNATTSRTDDYILYKQVNADPAEVVSRNLLQTPGEPFFEYSWIRNPPSSPVFIEEVPAGVLPLTHSEAIHGSTADTAAAARIDSLRGVRVNLSWPQAVDEAGGESDVTRYVIWRRQAAQPDWGDPYLSIPSGQPTYTYQDLNVTSGEQYYYGIAVQDCTPTLSTQESSALVTVP
jgi:prepilin-type N-terminal cleavage/methylation domain-containing protein